MSEQNMVCDCDCGEEFVELPVKMSFKVNKSALGTGGGIDPALPGIDFSLEEQWTGRRWIDGKKIYQKTVDCGAMTNKTTKVVPHEIQNRDLILFAYGFTLDPRNGGVMANLCHSTTGGIAVWGVNEQNISINCSSNFTAYTTSFITLLYTCTDR